MSEEERFRQISLLAGGIVDKIIAFDTTLLKEHGIHADLGDIIRALGYIEGLCGLLEEEEE